MLRSVQGPCELQQRQDYITLGQKFSCLPRKRRAPCEDKEVSAQNPLAFHPNCLTLCLEPESSSLPPSRAKTFSAQLSRHGVRCALSMCPVRPRTDRASDPKNWKPSSHKADISPQDLTANHPGPLRKKEALHFDIGPRSRE